MYGVKKSSSVDFYSHNYCSKVLRIKNFIPKNVCFFAIGCDSLRILGPGDKINFDRAPMMANSEHFVRHDEHSCVKNFPRERVTSGAVHIGIKFAASSRLLFWLDWQKLVYSLNVTFMLL